MNNILIVNIEKLKAGSYLDKNVENNTIRVAVLYVQDEVIEHVIGTCLFDRLKELICSGEIDKKCFSHYKALLDEYLFPIFTYAVQAEISIPRSFKIRNSGTIQQTGDNFQQAGLSDIKYLNSFYRNKADFYIQRAIKFLLCNRELFCELCHCECAWCSDRPLSKQPMGTNLNLKPVKVRRRIR